MVHIDHGIGTYNGITLVHDKECMVLLYHGGDRLFVPLERLDLIQKYSSTEGSKPQLDKLGGTTWIARKTRVKKAIRDMAQEFLQLYAQRKVAVGYAFSTDTEWQKEFEEAFQYDETPDQLTAIADIKKDMESPLPMDRLICGDVGYGKTEVAMRAAFKAVIDGKQVAVLAPTTILVLPAFRNVQGAIRRISRYDRHAQPIRSAQRTEGESLRPSKPARSTSSLERIAFCRRT